MLYTKHLKYIVLTDFLRLKVQVFQKLPCLSVLVLNMQQTLEIFVWIKNSIIHYPDWEVMNIVQEWLLKDIGLDEGDELDLAAKAVLEVYATTTRLQTTKFGSRGAHWVLSVLHTQGP
jgi:hypothetical protein